jgi:hypothetical protein
MSETKTALLFSFLLASSIAVVFGAHPVAQQSTKTAVPEPVTGAKGTLVIAPQFDAHDGYHDGFHDGLAIVYDGFRKWGFIDKTGRLVISPQFEDVFIHGFLGGEGLASVRKDGKWGFIDKTGGFVIPPQFDGTTLGAENADGRVTAPGTGRFHEGLAPVRKGGKWGFVDKTGKLVIASQLDWAFEFQDGLARVMKNGKVVLVDKTGATVLPLDDFKRVGSFHEGLAGAGKGRSKLGFIDATGAFVIPEQFDEVGWFIDGLAPVKKNGKWGFIDKTGTFVIPPEFDDFGVFSEGLARAKQAGKWGFIDKTGTFIIPPEFQDAGLFSEGLARAYKVGPGKWGFIDKTGKFVIPPEFEDAGGWRNNRGYMTQTGTFITSPREDVGGFHGGLAAVKKNGKWGFIDKTGTFVAAPEFDEIYEEPTDIDEGRTAVKKNGKIGYVAR